MERKPIIQVNKQVDEWISEAKDEKMNTNLSTNTNTTPSTIISTNLVTIKEKIKYTDIKTQRAYWIDNELVKIFDKNFPTKKYDKSEIINQLLKNFLFDKGLIE